MHTEAERVFYRRIYILIGLTAAIICSLFYLLYLTRMRNNNEIRKDLTFHKIPKQDRIVIPEREILVKAPEETVPADPKPEPDSTDPKADVPDSPAEETPADIDSNSSLLRIVSPARRIEAEYVPSDLTVPDVPMYQTQMLRRDAAAALEDMFAAAKADGYDLYLISGYRSYDYQTGLWDYYTDYYGSDYTERMDARPGGSEHQLGLSVDIGTTDDVCRLDTCFGDTGAFAWLQNNSYRYGYIERYPADGESTTGIMYSPWSFRYTGPETAEKLRASGQTMEEYFHTN